MRFQTGNGDTGLGRPLEAEVRGRSLDPVDDLRDRVARQDEYSHVDAATRERIRAIIVAGDDREDLAVTAGRMVAQLSPSELAQLLADWLESQTAI